MFLMLAEAMQLWTLHDAFPHVARFVNLAHPTRANWNGDFIRAVAGAGAERNGLELEPL